MRKWMLPRITDYWDCRANAVFQMAARLAPIDRNDRGPAMQEIDDAVRLHLSALSTDQVLGCAWVMADDLYRSSTALSYWDDSIEDYLRASARPVLEQLTALGYSLRYFIDNDYKLDPVGLALPVNWLPIWFAAAGFSYVCPQEIAFRRINSDRRRADYWTDVLPEYIADARDSAQDVVRRCRLLGTHFVFLDAESHADAGKGVFENADPGTVIVFRNLAVHLSSTCLVKITPPVT